MKLSHNTLLNNRYQILDSLGQGGFGITYLALDTELKKKVCIKELFIDGVCIRHGNNLTLTDGKRDFPWAYFIDNFKKEAQKIAEFRHPNIVSVSSVFEANGTAYYVMEFIEGETIKARMQQMGRAFTAEELKPIINQLFDAVDELHNKGLLHRDLKPDNIMIDKNDRIILIDFGSARENMDEKTATLISNTTLIFLTHGYAAPEMYSTSVIKGRYTDIYSLGATLYYLLTNQKPVVVNDRHLGVYLPPPHELNPKISGQNSSAIMLALKLKKEERFQNVEDFRAAFNKIIVPNPNPGNKDNRAFIYSILGGLTIIMLLFFVLIFLRSSNEQKWSKKNKDTQRIEKNLQANSKKQVKITEKEQYIIDLYNQLGGEGKFGPFEDFKDLIKSDPSYQKDFYNAFGERTLGPFEDFKYMVTLELSPSTKENTNKENKESENNVKTKNTYILPIMVQIPGKNYLMGKYEVTQEEWVSVMGSNPSYFQGCSKCPVETVNWTDIQVYIQKLNKLTGKQYRLPYSSEWEHAAKAGTNYEYAGSDNIAEVAWYIDNSYNKTHEIGQKKPNNCGLYDMTGNVWEWCQDLEGSNRVLRGGSWFNDPQYCRVSFHFNSAPNYRLRDYGFRLVLVP
jgi:serine/threonine protein kinase